MATYLLPEIRELVHQLTISPTHLRASQIEGTRRLVDEVIDPARAYPYELVCFHVTGYQPAHGEPDGSLPGKELIRDLVGLVEELTAARPVPVESVEPAVLDTPAIAKRLNVSTKTIQRWRGRGLIGERFLHADGSIQLGFREASVEQFVARHPELVRRASSFRNLSAQEKAEIIRRARELAKVRRTTLHEVAKKLAVETGRAVETLRYTIRRHDRQHPDTPVFDASGRPVVNVEHERLYRAHRSGTGVDELAAESGLTVGTVKRILKEMRVRALQADPPEYIYNPEFDAPNADELILDAPGRSRADVEASLSAGADVLLDAAEERDLFRRYNYLKCRARTLLDGIEPTRAKAVEVRRIERLLAAAERVRNRLARANLRLVTSIAKRHVGPTSDLPEVTSDGNMSLLRAIEKFDYARGNKFSTYATWAIMRNYARTIPAERYLTARYVTGTDEMLAAAPDRRPDSRPDWKLAGVREAIDQVLGLLTAKERKVVAVRYGLTTNGETHTLEQIGRTFGVTKERVRQIEQGALVKLREALGTQCNDLFD